MSVEAMKQALEALESLEPTGEDINWKWVDAAKSLRQAIEQAEKQEPVAYQNTQEKCRIETVPAQGGLLPTMQEGKDFTITHPQPQREWVGLTDEQIDQGLCRTPYAMKTAEAWREGVRWAYHQIKEKNT
jgi:hypothetical protein